MKNWATTLLIVFLSITNLIADELRAGVITIDQVSQSSVEATVSLVIDIHADLLDLSLCWGDGNCSDFPALTAVANPVWGIKSYVFTALHTYATQDNYTVSIEKCCFDDEISNINSLQENNFVIVI